MRHRVVHLSAAARRTRLHAEGKILLRARDPRACAAHRPTNTICIDGRYFQTEVTNMRWDEAAPLDRDAPNRGDVFQARYVVMSNGPLQPAEAAGHSRYREVQRPHLPHQPLGLQLHRRRSRRRSSTSSTTSASASSAPARRRCSAYRISASMAKHLYVFQRTPSSVDVRGNSPTDPEWASRWSPVGRRSARRISRAAGRQPSEEDLVGDGWTESYPQR